MHKKQKEKLQMLKEKINRNKIGIKKSIQDLKEELILKVVKI